MKHSERFFNHTCVKCGCLDEAKFVIARNGAVKQVCNACGAYVKFFNKALVPSLLDIKQKIWYITERNLVLINSAKAKVEFIECTGMAQQIMYWKLYLQIIKDDNNP